MRRRLAIGQIEDAHARSLAQQRQRAADTQFRVIGMGMTTR